MKLAEDAKAAIDKIESDLEWRGPTGRTKAYVLIPREFAKALLSFLRSEPAPQPHDTGGPAP